MSNEPAKHVGYHKGDNRSGGGGSNGGGGKNGPSREGLEKGDLKRSDNVSDFDELTAKPGKNSKLLREKRRE